LNIPHTSGETEGGVGRECVLLLIHRQKHLRLIPY
jgi:hypothetical protein